MDERLLLQVKTLEATAAQLGFKVGRLPELRDDSAAIALLQAANLIRDAAVMLEHPGLRRMSCIVIESGVHAIPNLQRFETLCGAPVATDGSARWQERAPTCPKCIEILVNQPTDWDALGKEK